MSKKTALILKIVTAIVLIGAIILGVYYGVSYFSEANKVASILEMGNLYMEASDYENAIVYFEQGLDYEPESEEIRNAISHAYILMAESYGTSDDAVSAYQNALTYNPSNPNPYWGIAAIYEERGDEDNVMISLNTGYENTSDENMRLKVESIEAERARIKAEEEEAARIEAERAALEAAHAEILQKLYECFEGDDMDAVKELIRTDEYIALSDEIVNAEDSFYYGEKDAEGKRHGKGVAVYLNGYYYFGEYDNDVRSGEGKYIRAVYSESSALGSFIYEGSWLEDKPNGEGVCISNFFKDKIGSEGLSKQVVVGTYADGLENGAMSLSGTTKSGGTATYTYKAENGVAKKSSDEDSGTKGLYIIAKSGDGKSNLTSDGSLRGVEGFLGE